MKVVQINCSASGSTGNIAKAIHKELLRNGHESYIFYCSGVGSATEPNMVPIGNYFSLHAHAVLSRYLGRQGYFSYFATLKAIKRIESISPDIIHLHNLHGSYLNLPLLFKYLKSSRCRVLLTLHDCWLFTGKCPHFTVIGCNKWKNQCGKCPQLSIYPRSKIDMTKKALRDKKKWLSGFGDRLRIVAVSNWLSDTAKQSYLSQYSIETIHNGIDIQHFQPRDTKKIRDKYNLKGKIIILGVASIWDERKGLGEFLQLSRQLSDNEVIVLVGLSHKQCINLPHNIICIERTEDRDELANLYSAANVFVNASREETFGLVTAEAMACGTPVVVFDSTACAEVICDGCIPLKCMHPSVLHKAIQDVCLQNKRDNCRKHIAEYYNTDKMIRGYLNVYNDKT